MFTFTGSAISLGASVGPLFIQLGIWNEFNQRGKKYNTVHMHKEDLTPSYEIDCPWLEEEEAINLSHILHSFDYKFKLILLMHTRIPFTQCWLQSVHRLLAITLRTAVDANP